MAAAALLARAPMPAQECPAVDPPPVFSAPVCPAVDRVGGAGLRVFLDRRTGRLRAPTPEEARALVEAGGRGVEFLEPLEVVVHPNGMRSVDLKGAFSSRVLARRNPDGSVTARCLPDRAGAEKK